MKPYAHARNSVRKFGGLLDDYLPIHNFIDSSKAHHADMRHRAILHSSFGIYLAELVFGVYFKNSDGNVVQVRDVAEHHVIEDLGRIPPVSDYLKNMKLETWMGGPIRKARKPISLVDKHPEPEVEQDGRIKTNFERFGEIDPMDLVIDGAARPAYLDQDDTNPETVD